MLTDAALALDLAAPLAHYAEHGWARLGVVAAPETLAELRARADAIMLGEVRHPDFFFQRDAASGDYFDLDFDSRGNRGWAGPRLDYRKVEKVERDPVFRAWLENALFGRLARAVVGEEVALFRAVVFGKAASGGTELPWHQDGGRMWGLDRDPELQVWTALDDAPEDAGCLEVVDGTHRAGLAGAFGGRVPKEALEARGAEASRLLLPAAAGEALLVHNHLWHRSGRNATGRPRRAFSACFMPASTRCTRKRKAPRTFERLFVG